MELVLLAVLGSFVVLFAVPVVFCEVTSSPIWALLLEMWTFFLLFLLLLRNWKQPFGSSTGGQSKLRSSGNVFAGPKTFNSLKHSVSIISLCHGIETLPVLNLL